MIFPKDVSEKIPVTPKSKGIPDASAIWEADDDAMQVDVQGIEPDLIEKLFP
jgi:hypothetical protein